MEILDAIGTYVVNRLHPEQSYIIGASEEMNENFRKKLHPDQTIEEAFHLSAGWKECKEQAQWREKNFERMLILPSDNYNDIMKVTGMPKNCTGGQYGETVREQLVDIMNSFYKEELTTEDVMQKVKNICKDMRVFQVQERHTNGYNKEDNKQILGDIYTLAQKMNVNAAVGSCLKKGEAIATEYGGVKEYNWMYYDASYYYKNEELGENIKQAISEMADEWETEVPDFIVCEKNSALKLNGGFDFNRVWQWQAWQRSVTCMTNVNAVPPRDFTFFYQEQKNADYDEKNHDESEKGIVKIGFQGDIWTTDIPYDRYADNAVEFFHMKDVIMKYIDKGMGKECEDFISNFDIFTKIWASTKSDDMWTGVF